jgi:hypothetical protein
VHLLVTVLLGEHHVPRAVGDLRGSAEERVMSMYLVTEFRRYAQECRHMADTSRNKQDKDQWKQLGERWLRCAENVEREEAARERTPRRTPRNTGRIKGLPQKAA